MANRGSGAGVMPLTAGEPWKYAEQEAAENNALFRMFKQQEHARAMQEDSQRNTMLRDANQDEQQYGREMRGQAFTREGWDRQDGKAASAASAKLDADTIKFAKEVTNDLVRELNIPEHAARGMVAEAMAESGDFRQMQELKPLVPGSRGGANIMQWTGPRRVALEQFAARNGLDPMDKNTGRAFLIEEMKGPEGRRLLPHLMKSKDAWEAAMATRQVFLRPQSVQEGWVDEGRNRRVRSRLFLPDVEEQQQAPPTQTASAPVSAQPAPQSVQQQPQVATRQAAAGARPKVERTIGPDGRMIYRPVQ